MRSFAGKSPIKLLVLVLLAAFFVALGISRLSSPTASAQNGAFDWRSDWALEEGFFLSIDTEGYHLPTAIAFVPQPGDGPKDPLYFVTEVRGTVKVVTNDRTVYTFAENFFQLTPAEELPSGLGQVGLAGICLDPERGYVFVTFAYQDSGGVLLNNVVRFQSEPKTFSLKPSSQVEFKDVFLGHESGLAHQIGPCQVNDDLLYVSVGEAWRPTEAQKIDAMVGKVIRMTLDGKPVPDNPFYEDDSVEKTANYVWAYGLRNPFGLKIVNDRVFVADNGNNIDRFLEIHEGENYFWDGNDWSIATNADFVFVPSLAPVQLDYYPETATFFPEEYRGHFFVALAGVTEKGKMPGIVTLPYSLEENRLVDVPRFFLRYRGEGSQIVSGLAFGPDGLYFAPILPNAEGRTAIYKITYDPARGHPFSLAELEEPVTLMREKGCLGCHQLNDDWGFGGAAGPPLDTNGRMISRIRARLNSEAYARSVAEVDRLQDEPYVSYREERQEVLSASGVEKIRLWMKYHIIEPKFDNPYSQMPNLGLTEAQALLITDYLLGYEDDAGQGLIERGAEAARRMLPVRPGRKHLLFFFLGGFVLGGFVLGSSWLTFTRLIRKPSSEANGGREERIESDR